MVLDFRNITQKAEYDYLEQSLTDAIVSNLRQRFVYRETRRSEWEAIAKENHIAQEDYHTYTAAMNLGLAAKQDVIIFGGFLVEPGKGMEVPEMKTRVRILDVGKKKQIADFVTQNPIDNTVFDSVEKIAARIVEEARSVLPSKEDFAKGKVKVEIPSFHQLSLRGHYSAISFPQTKEVGSTKRFAAIDFPAQYGFSLGYHFFGILWEQLGVTVQGMFRQAGVSFPHELNDSPIKANLVGVTGTAGIVWRQWLVQNFYIEPSLGGGLSYDALTFDYTSQTIEANSPSGLPQSQKTYTVSSPLVALHLRVGYFLTRSLSIESGFLYHIFFFQDSVGQNTFFDLGLALKF
ncbi:MAG: hypothetical protein NZM25_07010 [Leptospiraceae bacterium]|nr:hypothetical protein [Leptospiraceae bacterium]MDW8307069.1 hypothetical protein [Leptospiraceae bacterium]